MKALICIAHGSKKKSSNDEFLEMVENIKTKDENFNFVYASFLELATPSIQESVFDAIEKGAKKIEFYPFFLNSGKHVLIDIPEIIKKLQLEYKQIDFTLLPHFGSSSKIVDIILEDIKNN